MEFGAVFDNRLSSAERAFFQRAIGALMPGCDRLEIPAAGSLELCHAAVAAGVRPAQIVAGGSNLATVIVGAQASGFPPEALLLRFTGDLVPLNDLLREPNGYGAMLVGYHAAQLRADVYHENLARREMLGRAGHYAAATQSQIEKALRKLQGIEFRFEGYLEHLDRAMRDPKALLVVLPPRTTDGITAADKRAMAYLDWPGVDAQTYKPGDRQSFIDLAMISEALTLVLADQTSAQAWPEKVVFAHEQRADRVNYVLCSRPELLTPLIVNRPETRVAPPDYPMIDDGVTIGPDSTLAFVPTTREVAMYLRDLWAHKLGATRSECYFLFLVDGRAAGVFGMFFDHFEANRSPHVSETFGFNAPLRRHKRFNKLMMMCLVSGEARDFFVAQPGPRSSLLELTIFQTTCISSHPELKTNRGLLKLVERRDLPGGRYYLNYRAPFNTASFRDCLLKWLKKDAKYGESDAAEAA
jgi:hypothetical protein